MHVWRRSAVLKNLPFLNIRLSHLWRYLVRGKIHFLCIIFIRKSERLVGFRKLLICFWYICDTTNMLEISQPKKCIICVVCRKPTWIWYYHFLFMLLNSVVSKKHHTCFCWVCYYWLHSCLGIRITANEMLALYNKYILIDPLLNNIYHLWLRLVLALRPFNFRESSVQESCVWFELGDCSGDYEDSVKCPCEECSGQKDGCGSLLCT